MRIKRRAGVLLKVDRMESIPINANPYNHDLFHQGMHIGSNIVIMYATQKSKTGSTEICNYFIVCNKDTGERYRIALNEAGEERTSCEVIMEHIHKEARRNG